MIDSRAGPHDVALEAAPGKDESHRLTSLDAKLGEVVIHVPVPEHAPCAPAHGAERGMAGPRGLLGAPGQAIEELPEGLGFVQEHRSIAAGQQSPGRGQPFGKRQVVDDELLQGKEPDRNLFRRRGYFPERNPESVVDMRHHRGAGELSPARRSIRAEPVEPVEQLVPRLLLPDGWHDLPFAPASSASSAPFASRPLLAPASYLFRASITPSPTVNRHASTRGSVAIFALSSRIAIVS